MNLPSFLLAQTAPTFDDETVLGILGMAIPILGILIGPLIVYIYYRAKAQRERLWHETARIALEKGQPLPKHLESEKSGKSDESTFRIEIGNQETQALPAPARDIRTGLILSFLGAGLFMVGHEFNDKAKLAAYIVGAIGLAKLIFGLGATLSRRQSGQEKIKSDQ